MVRFSLVFLLFPTVLLSQWKTNSGKNDFDGSYKMAYVVGTGGEYPDKPLLTIIKFEDSPPRIQLSGIGYVGCERNTLRLLFNDDDGIIQCDRPRTNPENDILSIPLFENISQYSFFELIREKSKISIRHSSSCEKTDYEFDLNGSSKALDYVIADYFD